MIVTYEMLPAATSSAYWYRWRTNNRFKLAVLAAGLVPATLVFAFMSTAFPREKWIAVVVAILVEAASPFLFAALIRGLSRRGRRTLMIDADGVSTEVPNGQWSVNWKSVQEVAATPQFVFILGRGINSVSIPANAFADDEEREEFLRRANRYLESVRAR